MNTLIKQLESFKVIPVIAVDYANDILPLGELLVKNGLPVAEITLRTPAALEAIRQLRKAQPNIVIGAGSVRNEEQVYAAIEAGADFIVSAGLNPCTVKACQKRGVPIIPGVSNASNIEQAIALGLTTLKFFPAEQAGGIPMLKALSGPYFDITFMPTGGINKNNIKDYLALRNVVACGGSWMVDKSLISAGKWHEVDTLIFEAVSALK